jgi:murein DD-endopeptidase MepM/ murein hydrolase activator NlpD
LNRFPPTYNTRRIRLQSKRTKKTLWLLLFFPALLWGYFLLDVGPFLKAGRDSTPKQKDKTLQAWDKQSDSPMQTQVMSTSPDSAPQRVEKTLSVSSGDTLIGLLSQAGVARAEAHSVISSLEEVFNPRRLRKGQEINLTFTDLPDQGILFHSLNLKLDIAREVQVQRCDENGFVSREIVHELETRPVLVEAAIDSSLYDNAVNAGVPMEVLVQMIRAYSFDIDFQRDIQPGDEFALVYQEESNPYDETVRGGAMLYSSLAIGGRTLAIYRYETKDGEIDFFDGQGKSVGKTLMVTPIDGARLTSRYGNRRHPILGYSRMHLGLDFAAPPGTPVMAAGDGIIEFAARKGDYGNYIRIRHPNEYRTVYAHLSRFASGVRRGTRVKQGQTIGYVGSTGLSTGPHLHYEVHHRGKHVNPAAMASPPSRTLKGQELERFMIARKDLETLFASLQDRERLALLEETM